MRTSVTVIHPYWEFWESSVPGDLRADRTELLARATVLLTADHEVAVSALVASPSEAAALAEHQVDAVVVVSTMAAPPATAMALLDRLPGVPVVVWALDAEARLPHGFTHADITARGATVGAPMVTSALARAGRPYAVALTTLDEPEPALRAVRRAAAAGRVCRSTLLRIGRPIPGYTSVDAGDDQLARLGIRVARVEPAEVAARRAAVGDAAVRDLEDQVREEFEVDPSVSPGALRAVLRVEAALTDLVRASGAAAGALNCHLPGLRLGPGGVAPCLALGRLTTRGVPWTCTGDAVTAVAMLTVQALGHPTLYHEIEAVDHERDEVVLANSGEHDLRLCGPGRARLMPDVWYAGDEVTGPCAVFSIPEGPASLVAFTFAEGPRYTVAEGRFTGRDTPLTGTPNAGFRFAAGHVRDAWPRWAAAGVTHHSVATDDHVAADLLAVADHLGASSVVV